MADETTLKVPEEVGDYNPTPAEQAIIAEVDEKFDKYRELRRPHEIEWFVNAAMIRGLQYVQWNGALNRLDTTARASKRIRLVVNRIRPKLKARMTKFTSVRPKPQVVPASTDREDKLNARATQKVLDYIWRITNLNRKYIDALAWAQIAGKGFWWFYWDSSKMARIKDGETGVISEQALGDVDVEVGTPFEMFPSDISKSFIGDQPEIIRAKIRAVADVQARYDELGKFVKGEVSDTDAFQYEKRISQLTARGVDGVSASDFGDSTSKDNSATHVLVKEHFIKPCGKYPQGAYRVVANGVLLKNLNELPYDAARASNPYPCVEFSDSADVGQFWPATMCSQLIGPQKEYNNIRSKMAEHLRMMVHGKLLAPIQLNIPDNAWNTASGEIVRYLAVPGMPPPTAWHPPNIVADTWRAIDLIKTEFDELTNIYPASTGGTGDNGESGFQTNLLQEASDSVHQLDMWMHEMAIEDAAMKIRRIIRMGYDVPRLITVTGRNYAPDAFEFSADQIDENADIVVHTSGALSKSPAVRTKQILELFNSGVLGDPVNPEVKRKTLGMLDMGDLEEYEEFMRRDEEMARLENLEISKGMPVEFPKPWENHDIHYSLHSDEMKTPEFKNWAAPKKLALVSHHVMHVKYIDPKKAAMLAEEFGLTSLLPLIMPPAPPAPPPPPMPGPPPAGPGGPPPEMGPGMPPPGPPMPVPGPEMMPPPPGPVPMGGPAVGAPMPPIGPTPGMPIGPAGPPLSPAIPAGMVPGVFAQQQPQPQPIIIQQPPPEPTGPKRRMTKVVRDRTGSIVGLESIEE